MREGREEGRGVNDDRELNLLLPFSPLSSAGMILR